MINPTTFSELENLFKQRIESDKSEFGTDSVYLPNPEICLNPEFCLIAMEPSVGKRGIEGTRKDVKQGFRNFLYSEEDFILHFCAYSYLCDNAFHYYITDVSKGAMRTLDANNTLREFRYQRWLPLLKDELSLLGNPKTIAIGHVLERQLNNLSFKPDYTILHYSWSNSRWIKKQYTEIADYFTKTGLDNIEGEPRHFATVLMERIGYTIEMRDQRLERRFHRLSNWKKALLVVYRHDFQRIRNGTIR